MSDYYVFDIPIYRCEEGKFYRQMTEHIESYFNSIYDGLKIPRPATDPPHLAFIRGHMQNRFGAPWDFNQVVGWLRLFVEGSGIGGHLWMVDAKRVSRSMHKRFTLRSGSNVLAFTMPPDADSATIYRITLESIRHLSKIPEFRKRVFDLREFQNIGPFVNWKELILAAHKASPDARGS